MTDEERQQFNDITKRLADDQGKPQVRMASVIIMMLAVMVFGISVIIAAAILDWRWLVYGTVVALMLAVIGGVLNTPRKKA